tara:strand:+ start:1573 stop:1788 length:216 start_codon:yes stop_codon:yes gene_type:complete
MSKDELIKELTSSRDKHRAAYMELDGLCLDAARILDEITDGHEGSEKPLSVEYIAKIEELQLLLRWNDVGL